MLLRRMVCRRSFVLSLICVISLIGSAVGQANWTWRNPLPTNNCLKDIAYGNNTFVAISQPNTILTSSDGITWTMHVLNTKNGLLFGITYGNGTFVAVGRGIYTSTDGITWIQHPMDSINDFSNVCYGNNTFVAVGADNIIATSTNDGATWTKNS